MRPLAGVSDVAARTGRGGSAGSAATDAARATGGVAAVPAAPLVFASNDTERRDGVAEVGGPDGGVSGGACMPVLGVRVLGEAAGDEEPGTGDEREVREVLWIATNAGSLGRRLLTRVLDRCEECSWLWMRLRA